MPYSLATRCMTEMLGTSLAILLGDSVIANELLPLTKGHGMGFGWIATAFGMAFGLAILIFSQISSHLNPAMVFALFLIGRLSFVDFICLALAEMAGGFVGAVAMYIVYMPHFRTVPEPAASSIDASLIRSRDSIDTNALRVASYNTKSSPSQTNKSFDDRLRELKYYLSNENANSDEVFKILSVGTTDLAGLEIAFPSIDAESGNANHAHHPPNITNASNNLESLPANTPAAAAVSSTSHPSHMVRRRHSIQVAEMQRRLRNLERSLSNDTETHQQQPQHHTCLASPNDSTHVDKSTTLLAKTEPEMCSSVTTMPGAENTNNNATSDLHRCQMINRNSNISVSRIDRTEALHRAAILADQAVKLSAFCNRPAIYLPIHNFLVELICTLVLILGALLIDDRFAPLDPSNNNITSDLTAHDIISSSIQPILVAIFIQVCVLALGGPTGFSANPARDAAPRFAHWILPIPGKGKSEWNYSLYVNLGVFCGAAIAAGLFMVIKQLQISV